MEEHLAQIQPYHQDVTVQRWSVQVDHIHVVPVIPPTYAVSNIVGQDESESESATCSSVPRAEADLLGGGAVVSRVFLVDSWVIQASDPAVRGPSRTSGQRASAVRVLMLRATQCEPVGIYYSDSHAQITLSSYIVFSPFPILNMEAAVGREKDVL